MSAIEDIAAERRRQIEVEGFSAVCDDLYTQGELPAAAACYATGRAIVAVGPWFDGAGSVWPWSRRWWKPTDRRRDLIKAGALIVAEIERLDRLALPTPTQEG